MKTLDQAQKDHILEVLEAHKYVLVHAAKVLQISRACLYAKMKKYDIKRPVEQVG